MSPTIKEKPTQVLPTVPDDQLKMPEDPFLSSESIKKSFNIFPWLVGIVVLLLIILSGLVYWSIYILPQNSAADIIPTAQRPTAAQNNEPESTTAEAQVETLNALSSSDELFTIAADLDGTNVEGLDTELTAIETELGL